MGSREGLAVPIRIRTMVVLSGLGAWLASASDGNGAEPQAPPGSTSPPLKAGIIGLDTSHVVAFTRLLNAAERPRPSWPACGSSRRIPAEAPTSPPAATAWRATPRELKEKYGVAIVGSIDELLAKVDVVLLESVDGRPHLEQARPVFKARKPVFIDKPVAGIAGRRDRHLRPRPGKRDPLLLQLVAPLRPRASPR